MARAQARKPANEHEEAGAHPPVPERATIYHRASSANQEDKAPARVLHLLEQGDPVLLDLQSVNLTHLRGAATILGPEGPCLSARGEWPLAARHSAC